MIYYIFSVVFSIAFLYYSHTEEIGGKLKWWDHVGIISCSLVAGWLIFPLALAKDISQRVS
jgi:hypothetical protein